MPGPVRFLWHRPGDGGRRRRPIGDRDRGLRCHFDQENHVTQPPYAPPQGQPAYGLPPNGGQPYGQMGPGQVPYGTPQPPAPEKKPLWKKTWFRVVAALFVIAVIGSATSGGDKTADSTAAGASDAPAVGDSAAPAKDAVEEVAPEPAMPGIGQPAADGDFNFV